MSEIIKLEAETRDASGKTISNALRNEGRIPAIIYGGGKDEIRISLNAKEVTLEYNKGNFQSKIIEVIAGKDTIKALPRDIQLHPVTDKILHADFQRVTKDSIVNVYVKVIFSNHVKSPGLKRGGILNIVRREVELACSPDSIPSELHVDLSGKQIGEAVHVSAIDLPEGTKPVITDRDFTIATIVGKGATEEEEDAVAAASAESEEEEAAEATE